ncbi:MAG: InlB B-repeat-containing protein, partial [Candidatus Bathyarchaeota archaeon]|nr:InlB B-repeat-containing protein [Candidatus Termiticorpusculum sp.]
MSAGVIANNTAAGDGGGVYVVTGGFFELLAGRVSDNVAGNNGGGIWITNTDNFEALEKLYIAYGVEFRDNSASVLISLTSLSVSGEGIYRSQVEIADGSWTNGELFGINNYDISFTGKCIVIYDPGTQGTWRAEQEAYGNLDFGSSTPVFGTASGADYNVDHTYGWSFAGWLPAWSSTVSGDVTYVAQWTNAVEPIFYTVTYVGNGNSGGVAPVDRFSPYVEGERVVVLGSGSLTRDGYVFLGWATSGSASSVSFGVGSAFYISQDMTFYAVWESALYSVEYRPGLHGMFDVQVTVGLSFGDSTPVAPVVTGETGWIFTGWSPTPTTTVTGNAIYIAQWTQQTTPSPSPTPTLTPTVTPSPTPSPSATPTSPPTGTVPPGGGPTPSLSPSTSPSPPIGGDPEGTPAWALINLILTITGAILAIILTIYIL